MNCFVSGSSSGIGYELSKLLLDEGQQVWGLSRSVPDFDGISGYEHMRSDLSDLCELKDLGERLSEIPDTFDVVYLNAAIIGQFTPMLKLSNDALEEVFRVNVVANRAILSALLRHSKLKQVIAVSSGASRNGSPGMGGYSISKAALNMLIQTLAAENSGTHFSAVAPGVFSTSMIQYVSSQKSDQTYHLPDTFRQMQKRGEMPGPRLGAERLLKSRERLLELPSGGFHDIRDWF